MSMLKVNTSLPGLNDPSGICIVLKLLPRSREGEKKVKVRVMVKVTMYRDLFRILTVVDVGFVLF